MGGHLPNPVRCQKPNKNRLLERGQNVDILEGKCVAPRGMSFFSKENAWSRCPVAFCEGKVGAFDANVVILKGKCEVTVAVTTWWGVLVAFELALKSSWSTEILGQRKQSINV